MVQVMHIRVSRQASYPMLLPETTLLLQIHFCPTHRSKATIKVKYRQTPILRVIATSSIVLRSPLWIPILVSPAIMRLEVAKSERLLSSLYVSIRLCFEDQGLILSEFCWVLVYFIMPDARVDTETVDQVSLHWKRYFLDEYSYMYHRKHKQNLPHANHNTIAECRESTLQVSKSTIHDFVTDFLKMLVALTSMARHYF